MSDKSLTRRKLLAMGGSGMASALAGCSWQTSSDDDGDGTNDSDEPRYEKYRILGDKEEVIANQAYEIPPVKELLPHTETGSGEAHNTTTGVATIIWEETDDFRPTNSNDEYQFADELTFELFVYGESPTENEEVELVKVGEKTTHLGLWQEGTINDDGTKKDDDPSKPYGAQRPDVKHVYFEYDPSKVPKNQQIRFRLRITNNRTGKQEFAHDESMVYYLQYNDDLQFLYRTEGEGHKDDPYTYRRYPKSEENSRILEETTEGYQFVHRVMTEFPSEVGAAVPYSIEAESDDTPSGYEFVSDTIHRGDIVDIPRDGVELARDWYDSLELLSKEDIQFRQTVPDEYDYYGGDTYDVLDNPLLSKFADNINKAMDDYSVDNHYARIQSAVRLIQGFDYSEELGSKYRLPEQYFSETKKGDCVSHTMNLSWLLYHLGYAVGLAHLERDGANHVAPAIGIPNEVIDEDFPSYLQNDLNESPITTVGELNRYDNYTLDSLGDLNWLYIEATSTYPVREGMGPERFGSPIGEIPIEYNEVSIEAILEPEDPWFETGVSNTLPDR